MSIVITGAIWKWEIGWFKGPERTFRLLQITIMGVETGINITVLVGPERESDG